MEGKGDGESSVKVTSIIVVVWGYTETVKEGNS